MRNYQYALLLLLFFATSCSAIINLVSKDPDTEGKINVKSKFNTDNIIYTIGKLYTYEVTQELNNENINFDLTVQVIPGKYNGETKIKYKYYYSAEIMSSLSTTSDTLKEFKWEITSVDESADVVCIHPPRSYTLRPLELAAFPSVDLPLFKDKKWETTLWVGPGWKDYSNTIIKNSYVCDSINYETDSITTSYITATSSSKIDTNTVKFSFNSEKGFTSIKYELHQSQKISLKLKTVTNTIYSK